MKQTCQCKLCRAALACHTLQTKLRWANTSNYQSYISHLSTMNVISAASPGFVDSDPKERKLGEASISSLVPDILREIFEHGCSTPVTFTPEMTVAPALLYLQVCRSWRSLALAQSTLWSSIIWGSSWSHGGDIVYRTDRHERLAMLWDLYLSRSRQALLDVSLNLYGEDAPEVREHLIDSIFKEQHRLQFLNLNCDKKTLREGKAYLLTAAPKLSLLKISVYNGREAITVDLSGFTSLRELEVYGNVLLQGQMRANVIESLQTLSYQSVNTSPQSLATPASNPFSFLHHTPHIRHTEIFDEPVSPGFLPPPPLPPTRPCPALSHLRKLHLGMNNRGVAEFAESILADSEIPSLEEMVISFYDEPDDVYQRRRWTQGKILKKLKLLHIFWSQNGPQDPLFNEDLRCLLQCTPALKTLVIGACWISPQTFSLLTLRPPEDAASNLCPALEKLHLCADFGVPNLSSQDIIDLISSRWRLPQEKTDIEDATRFSALFDVVLSLHLDDSGDYQHELADLCTVEPLCSFIQQGLKLIIV